MQKRYIAFTNILTLALLINFSVISPFTISTVSIGSLTSPGLAAGAYESFEDTSVNWIIETDINGTGASVSRSGVQKHTGAYSAVSFTTNGNGKAQIRDMIASNWSSVPSTSPGVFIWQRAYLYVPSATANSLTGNEYLDLGGLYALGDLSGFYLRLKASAALYASAPGSSGQAEFNLYGTLPLDQWVEVELGLWSRNTGDLDRAGCFIINGKFYGWFTNGRLGTDYNRAAMGIVATNSADDLTVYVDDWYIYDTGTSPTGTDNRPTAATYTKDYTRQDGENIGYHYTTWENGYTLDPTYGLSPSNRIQSGIETSRMPDLSNGWSQIVIDWARGKTPPWPPDLIGSFFGPMIAFRKSVELEENLEVVPVYRSGTGSVDLVFESWTLGPIEYASWQLPMDGSGHRIPGRGDIIRVNWQEVSATQIRVRVDYYDASAGNWTIDAIDHTRALNNVNGVNFLADTHRAVTNTIDSNDYTIKSQTVGTLADFSGPFVSQIKRADVNPTGAGEVRYNVAFSKEVTGVDVSDFTLQSSGVTGATVVAVSGVGTTYSVTVNTGLGNGTLRMDVVDNDSIQDASHTPLGGVGIGNGNFTGGESYTIFKTTFITGTTGQAGSQLRYVDIGPKMVATDGSGNYSITIPVGWSGTVTPGKACYIFTPGNRGYNTVLVEQTGQNYTAVYDGGPYTMSGTTGMGGVTLNYFDGTAKTITSDGNGNYSITVPCTWSGTLTPSKTGYLFGPAVRVYGMLTGSQTNQNFNLYRVPPADFNGDEKADVAVFRPSVNTWYLKGQGSQMFGQAGDIPVPADYNGDGKDDIAVFRPGNNTWYIKGQGSQVYGQAGDIPVVADYTGDGQDDIAVFRPSTSTWYIKGVGAIVYGQDGDIPVVADYTGDGKADIAVFRPENGTWYLKGQGSQVYGQNGDIPVVADYTGDGKADIAVFRASTSTWYIKGMSSKVYGQAGDVPVVGDYTGDGKADLAVFRPTASTWYIYGLGSTLFGSLGDLPV